MESASSAVARLEIKGYTLVIDKADESRVASLAWQLSPSKSGRMHFSHPSVGRLSRWLMGAPQGLHVDHKNGNTLDNRRCNLRVCTHTENQWNRKRGHGATRLKGVARISDPRAVSKWRATIQMHGRRVTLGMFRTALEAAFAYDAAAIEMFGEFASPNFPERQRKKQDP